jgi:DHA2 family multidrug resistance protein-like MFS transporter
MYGGCILVQFGAFLFIPQYLQLVLGLSPLMAGLWELPWAIGFVTGSVATPALARRIPQSRLMCGGLVVSSVGYVLLAIIGMSPHPLPLFAIATLLLALGASPVFTLTNDIIVGSAPTERAGAATGISETCAELGGALGIAIFGSIGVAIYRAMLAHQLPVGLSVDATNAAISTLGGAVAIAGDLPGGASAALLHAAREAFLGGLTLCAVISGLGTLGLAIFAGAMFRRVRSAMQRTEEQPIESVA